MLTKEQLVVNAISSSVGIVGGLVFAAVTDAAFTPIHALASGLGLFALFCAVDALKGKSC